MGNLGGQEILVILLVGLIVLGPTKLPAAIRQAGRFAAETRRVAAGFKREFQEALGEPLAESKAMLRAADPRSLVPSDEAPAPAPSSADQAVTTGPAETAAVTTERAETAAATGPAETAAAAPSAENPVLTDEGSEPSEDAASA